MAQADLHGVSVLWTRPQGQGQTLHNMLEDAGAYVVDLPLLAIEAVKDESPLKTLGPLTGFDLVVFVSANAVSCSTDWMRPADFSASVIVAAVGAATARLLHEYGYQNIIIPETASNSEELLQCAALAGNTFQRVLIVRGQGGRPTLADALRSRGAEVEFAEVYRRVAIDGDPRDELQRWLKSGQPVVLLTSAGATDALLARCRPEQLDTVRAQPAVVLSQRLADHCREHGWQGSITVCAQVNDQNLLGAIQSIVVNNQVIA